MHFKYADAERLSAKERTIDHVSDTETSTTIAPVGTVQPSAEGRSDLAGAVSVLAHHSSFHDGVNIEIDAPAGTRITVHLNDWDLVDTVVPE